MKKEIIVETEEGIRLDQFLFAQHPELSRSYFAKLTKSENVLVNGKISKASRLVKMGDVISYNLINLVDDFENEPEEIDLNIIFENDDCLVINKQPGLVVHPAAGNRTGTLINGLLNYLPKISESVHEKGNPLSESRPGLVHRLDKDTSGVMIVAKNTPAMIFLSNEIKKRSARKTYLAICFGWPKSQTGRLIDRLARNRSDRKSYSVVDSEKGREAISNFNVREYFKAKTGEKISLVEFQIETGRTHQIRVQSKHAGFPVLGDKTYNTKESVKAAAILGSNRQLLHSCSLEINLPGASKKTKFEADLPSDFKVTLKKLISAE